jgi:hypothetical protein
VSKIEEDPFVQLTLLYQAQDVDKTHAPLLYGPYVIFKKLDGSWNRVSYDARAPEEDEIVIFGWDVLSITNANWRYLTVIAERERKKKKKSAEEFFFFPDF